MPEYDGPVFDADNHYYEAIDAFTRHLDPGLGRRIIQWAEIDGRKYHVIGGQGEPRRREPHVRPHRQGRRDVGVLPRATRRAASPWSSCASASRSGPSTATRDARLQVMDEQGVDKIWLFPTLGMLYEQALKHDPEGVGIMFDAFNRWMEEDWGFALRGPHLRRALHLARRRRRRGPPSSSSRSTTARA